MNCSESLELLHRQLDGVCGPPGSLDEHLADCAECRALHGAARRLEDGLRRLPRLPAPPSLQKAIVFQVLRERRRMVWRQRTVYAAVAVAASLLVAIVVPMGNRPSAPTTHQALPVAETPKAPTPTLSELGSAVVSLTKRTGDDVVGPTRSLIPEVPAVAASTLVDTDRLIRPGADTLRETHASVSAGLEPVTTSAFRAADLFVRDMTPRVE